MFSRSLLLALALATPVPLIAQTPADSTALLRARLATVERALGIRDDGQALAVAAAAVPRRVRVQVVGRITLVVGDEIPRSVVAAVASHADSVLAAFGGIPDETIRRAVLVHDALPPEHPVVMSALQGRPRVSLEWGSADDTLVYDGGRVTAPLARYYRAGIDTSWGNWTPHDLSVRWSAFDGDLVLDNLASPTAAAMGKECLAGRIRSCRLWLGIDDDSNSIMSRYTPLELVEGARLTAYGGEDVMACRGGGQSACLRAFLAGNLQRLPSVPAPAEVRASFLRALLVKHGPEALRNALADSTGSIGDRAARAAGVSEDSLVSEWRVWVLSRGRVDRVEAGAGDFVSALVFICLLATMAVRSGRWR